VIYSRAEVHPVGADELALDRQWWGIYQESFPENEREPAAVILESLRRRVGFAYRARLKSETIGIATTHLLMEPAAVFLVYLAAGQDRRGACVSRKFDLRVFGTARAGIPIQQTPVCSGLVLSGVAASRLR
jgi:hypothetical protein